MQIVSKDRVKLCPVIDNTSKQFSGLFYQGKLFQQIAGYKKEQANYAIKRGKEEFLSRKGQVLILVVEAANSFTIWCENNQLKPVIKPKKSRNILEEIKLTKLIKEIRGENGIEIKNRLYNLKMYNRCFIGSEATEWLVNKLNISTGEAILVGQKLIDEKWIHHVADNHSFENGFLFYRFYADDNEISEIAQTAFNRFSQGLATGNWDLFLEIISDDFYFSFPAGKFQGDNIGKERAGEFFKYVSKTVFTEGLFLTVKRITSSENTVVFEVESEGKMFGKPYENKVAISFDIRDNQICAYREYLSVIVTQ